MPQHRKKDCTARAYLSLSVYLYLLVYAWSISLLYCVVVKTFASVAEVLLVARIQFPIGVEVGATHTVLQNSKSQSLLKLYYFYSYDIIFTFFSGLE